MHRNVVVGLMVFMSFAGWAGWAAIPAHADVRAGQAADARDVPESINGPRQPDIETVRVVYDTAGSLTVGVRLFEPWPDTTRIDPNFEMYVGSSWAPYSYNCTSSTTGDVSLLGNLDPDGAPGTAGLLGYDGTLPLERTFSPDRRTTTFRFSTPQMAGRGYVCATRIGLYTSDPYGHCSPSPANCERISYRYTGDQTSDFNFDGFAPVRPACDDGLDNEGDGQIDVADRNCSSSQGTSEGPPPTACGNRRDDDGDGKTDRADPGCRGRATGTAETDPAPVRSSFKLTSLKATKRCRLDVEVEVLPDLTPEKLFPFKKVRLRVRGISGKGRGYRKTRRLPLGESAGYGFKLKPGRYRVSGSYPGDRFRKRSKTHTRSVNVCVRRGR